MPNLNRITFHTTIEIFEGYAMLVQFHFAFKVVQVGFALFLGIFGRHSGLCTGYLHRHQRKVQLERSEIRKDCIGKKYFTWSRKKWESLRGDAFSAWVRLEQGRLNILPRRGGFWLFEHIGLKNISFQAATHYLNSEHQIFGVEDCLLNRLVVLQRDRKARRR